MTQVRLSYPVVNVDFDSKTLGRFMVRYFPARMLLEWPDKDGTFGDNRLTVRRFQSPNPEMLRRDLTVRIKLAEAGFSFQDICALDSMDISDSPLTGAVRDCLSTRQRDRFDRLMETQAEERDLTDDDIEDAFSPLDEGEDDLLAEDGKPISIITYDGE